MSRARRGEIWLIDLGMVQKTRPCLVLSISYLEHERAVVTYIPRTTHLRQTRLRFSIVGLDFWQAHSTRKASAAFPK